MPGYVIHLAVASKIIERKEIVDKAYINDFILGNIIPDSMPREQKKASHFWDDETYKNLNRIPNLQVFLDKYGDKLNDPFVLGYYSHLMLDNLFVSNYWGEHFQMLDGDGKEERSYEGVAYFRMKQDGREYPRDMFLSDELYYGDYDRMYPYILERYNIYLPELGNKKIIPINEIDYSNSFRCLSDMISKVQDLKDAVINGEYNTKEKLKIFDLDHIYNLMDSVVSNVCEII